MYEMKFPSPNPVTPDEWANHLAAFSVSQHAAHVVEGTKANRARDIARDAVAIFIDRTTSSTSATTSDATMAKCVELAKMARALAEK